MRTKRKKVQLVVGVLLLAIAIVLLLIRVHNSY